MKHGRFVPEPLGTSLNSVADVEETLAI